VRGTSESYRDSVRLRCLYDVGRVLTDHSTAAGSAGAVIEIIARAIALRSALVVVDDGRDGRTLAWRSRGKRASGFRAAKAHFRDVYAYLVSSDVPSGTLRGKRNRDSAVTSYIVLPLAVSRGHIFGALQLELVGSASEEDLTLADAIASQLAVALDRRATDDARADLERALRAREALLATVAHELRNPLSVILMQTSNLLARPPEGPRKAEVQTSTEAIRISADRMDRLIGELLDVARIDAGRLTVIPRRTSAASLVEEALATEAGLAAEKDLKLTAEIETECDVLCDRDRILQVFSNLIGNATKFTPAGGSVVLRVEDQDDEVWFTVADSGPGISPEIRRRVFDSFWQAEVGSRSGLGIGLWIAKGIVEAHGGEIWVEGDGAGCSVVFTLPAVERRSPARTTNRRVRAH
jgi:signal transduction histidine kinase